MFKFPKCFVVFLIAFASTSPTYSQVIDELIVIETCLDEFEVLRGDNDAIDMDDLKEAGDGQTQKIQSGFVLNSAEPPVWVTGCISDPCIGLLFGLDFNISTSANTPGLTMCIEALNVNTNQWDEIGTFDQSFFGIQTESLEVPNWFDYIDDKFQFRVGWKRTGFVLVNPWCIEIDSITVDVKCIVTSTID